jgi:hypothetical protein
MTGPIKKARKERELDELAFNVLSSFRQQGAMQWTDWYETTTARRGKPGLGTTTFNDAVKRLMAAERVQIDGDGCYRVAYDAVEDVKEVVNEVVNIADTVGFADTADFLPAKNERSSGAFLGGRNGNADIADIALQQLMDREL